MHDRAGSGMHVHPVSDPATKGVGTPVVAALGHHRPDDGVPLPTS
jgi:hypothetical protein